MSGIDSTHDPALRSWVECAAGHGEFPIQNLPLGIFSRTGEKPRPGVAIGNRVLDLPAVTASCRARSSRHSQAIGSTTCSHSRLQHAPACAAHYHRSSATERIDRRSSRICTTYRQCTLHLPVQIGDYTDFYVGIHHATNVGRQFRPDNPLLPNYKYIPIGYHGRSSSVRASGAEVRRPHGQLKPADAPPSFGRTRRLDYEVELGVWIGRGNTLGEPIGIAEAHSHIAGLSLLNDWSARDIQAWEYQPLGPFLSKSFLTTVSPWIITSEALAPFRVPQPARPEGDPKPLDYLWNVEDQARGAYAITLEASIRTAAMRASGMAAHRLSRASTTALYWTVAQMIAHHTSNGCNCDPEICWGPERYPSRVRAATGACSRSPKEGKGRSRCPPARHAPFWRTATRSHSRRTPARPGFATIGFGSCRGSVTA